MQSAPDDPKTRRVTSPLGRLELCNVAAAGKAQSEDLLQIGCSDRSGGEVIGVAGS
jgi:hypothetical protein